MDKTTNRMKNLFVKHQTKLLIAVTVTAVTVITLQRLGLQQHDEFLASKDLYLEYYMPEA